MKKMFDKPGAVPLPPVSTSYGANQYSSGDTRQIPLQPRVPSDENRYHQEQRPPFDQSFQASSPPYRSYDNVSNQHSHKHSTQPPSTFYDQQTKRFDNENPTRNFSSQEIYREPRSPPGQANHQFGSHIERPHLSHYEPPPQHSQSMSNLDDLHPQENWTNQPQKPKNRNSYANNKQDNDMVVGVRFEKHNESQRRDDHQSSTSLPPTSFEYTQQPDKRNECKC